MLSDDSVLPGQRHNCSDPADTCDMLIRSARGDHSTMLPAFTNLGQLCEAALAQLLGPE